MTVKDRRTKPVPFSTPPDGEDPGVRSHYPCATSSTGSFDRHRTSSAMLPVSLRE